MTESEIRNLGFELSKSYDHNQYRTNRYENGDLEVEFTYENDALIDVDLTIEEINIKPITHTHLQKLVPVLGYRPVKVPPSGARGKICYIAHPVGHSWKKALNLEKIKKIVRKINLRQANIVPFVPYFADCAALSDSIPSERARGLKNGLAILRSGIVEELWLYGNRISEGMWGEILLAHELGIKIVPQTDATLYFLNKNRSATGVDYAAAV